MVAIVGLWVGFVSVRPYLGERGGRDGVCSSAASVAMGAVRCGYVGGGQPHLERVSFSQRCGCGDGDGICGGIDLQWAAAVVGAILRESPRVYRADDRAHHRPVLGADTSHCRCDDGWNPLRVRGGAPGRRSGVAGWTASGLATGAADTSIIVSENLMGLGLGVATGAPVIIGLTALVCLSRWGGAAEPRALSLTSRPAWVYDSLYVVGAVAAMGADPGTERTRSVAVRCAAYHV